MSLDYVKAGETVKASTVNSLVDAVGGPQNPSPDIQFATTARGAQLWLPTKFGGPNRPLTHYLDIGRSVVSAWPFVKLALGVKLDDCLETVRLHTADGEVATPISAAVVFKNSGGAPTGGDLSGYLLDEGEFGLDAATHAEGWVQTWIEDTNGTSPTRAELWSWEKPAKMAVVFTNVDSEVSVKNALSTALDEGGAEGLSALERVDSWRLGVGGVLSVEEGGQAKWVQTHQLVGKHGVIDVYDPAAEGAEHVNTAELVCYGVESHEDPQTGAQILDNAKFAWKYWLGPDSDYDDGNDEIKFVYSHSWTINGQPAVFKVDDKIETLADYEGTTVAMADDRGGYSVMYGEFESNPEDGEPDEQGKIDGGSLFVNFNYYDEYACMVGELGSSNNGTPSEMSRQVLLCQQRTPYTLAGEVAVGDAAPKYLLTYGTYSAVDKDWPLTDEEAPEHSGSDPKDRKSIQWKDNVAETGKTEPVDATGAKSLQLYRFAEVVKSECDCLSDIQLSDQMVAVVRREDADGNAWIDYLNIDDLSGGTVDSKCETLYLSSIQEETYTDPDGNERAYHQLYGFDEAGIELDRDNLDKFDLVVRDSNTPAQGAQVSYIPISSVLSTADVYTDTQKSQMSSIQYDDDGNGPYLELFKFNQGESEDLAFEDFGRYHMVVRDNEEGHVDYATLSGVASEIVSAAADALSVQVDSEISALMLSSIQTSSWTDPETDEEHRYHQLFNFQLSAKDVDWDLQEHFDVVLRDKYEAADGAIVNYMPLSCLMRRPDSEGDSGQKSTSIISGTQDLQLWQFDEDGQGTESADVPVWWKPPADALSDEILVRAGGAGGELMYKKLQLRQAKLSVDRGTYGTQKSLQYAEIDGTTFLELNGFHADGETLPAVTLTSADAPLLPADTEFLYRQKDQNGRWQLKYAPLSAKVSVDVPEEISVDTDVLGTQRSLEWAEDDGQEYLQLYGMDDPGQATEQVDLKYAKTGFQHLLPDDEEFVIRTGPGGEIVYKDVAVCLSAYLSGGGGGGGLSVDNVSLSTNADGEACIKGWNVDPKVSVNSQQLSGYGLVARDGNNQLKYLDLSVAQGGGGSALPQPWDMTIENGTATFTNCCARIARAYYFFPDQTLQVGSGDLMIYMQVEHKTAPAVTVAAGYYQYAQSFLSGSYSNCISASVQPLYRVIDGEVACDYRCMMGIQAYDNRAFSQTKPF